MWNTIVNPNTNRKVKIDTRLGKSILKKYIYTLKGGSDQSQSEKTWWETEGWKKKDLKSKGIIPEISIECDTYSKHQIEKEIDNILTVEPKITDIVSVGPSGYKPLHNGHLLLIKKAFEVANSLRESDSHKNILVIINTSCAGRRLEEKNTKTPWVIHRGTMKNVWDEFLQKTILSLRDRLCPDIPIKVFWTSQTAIRILKQYPTINIHPVISNESDSLKQLENIFKDSRIDKKEVDEYQIPSTTTIIKREKGEKNISGTQARYYIADDDLEKIQPDFLRITDEIINNEDYFMKLREIYQSNEDIY
uniref:Uncharacterized protein n=1 Tax=viral metagenome TaxID=1070528 RepID=A0A6C0J0H2_9ZZZZ